MTSLRNRLFPAVAAAFAIGAVAIGACASSNKTSVDTESTTTTTIASATTATVAATTTTAAIGTTVPATNPPATNPPATNPPATNPPTTAPQIITSFSVSDAAACPAIDISVAVPLPSVTVSWTVVGADSVNLLLDGGLWGPYGLSGSENLPASCDIDGHNTHTYEVDAIKGGQKIASKKATRGY